MANPADVAQIASQYGVEAEAVAETCIGTPYHSGATGPIGDQGGFDCSGLMIYCYHYGPGAPGIALGGRTVGDFWKNNTTLFTSYDALVGATFPMSVSDFASILVPGDIIIWMADGAGDGSQHCQMYAGNGKIIEAPATGLRVRKVDLLVSIGSSLPLRGVKRATGVGGPTGTGATTPTTTDPSSGSPANTNSADVWQKMVMTAATDPKAAAALYASDPTSNLPFVREFQTYSLPPGAKLIRGGMAELLLKRFRCYFMMNPQQIAADYNIDTTNITSPMQQDPSNQQYGGYFMTNNTINFTVYFNRMYDVWRGGPNNGPGGKPGPAQLGVRWDIRALERLIGIFDAPTAGGMGSGLGTNGFGGFPPQTYPLQVVFGGPNTLRFQGVIASLDWVFTLFDTNMIPIEAYADIGVMRVYQPGNTSPALSNALPFTAGAASQYMIQPQGSVDPTGGKTVNKQPTPKKAPLPLPVQTGHAR